MPQLVASRPGADGHSKISKSALCPYCYNGEIIYSEAVEDLICRSCRKSILVLNEEKHVIHLKMNEEDEDTINSDVKKN